MSNRRNLLAFVLSALLASALLLASCAGAAAPESSPVSREAAGSADLQTVANEFAASVPQADVERIVIKNASLTIVVDDPVTSMDRLTAMAEDMGGFVVSAEIYPERLDSGADVPAATITVRVPAGRFTEAITSIEAESSREPINKSINSQDVTQDYTDLQSRLRNLEDAEAQLREIMASAGKTEDVLSVYNQLVQVREQIEVIKGQILYYEQSAAFSAISVRLLPNQAVQPLSIGGWQPVGVARSAIQSLINSLKFIADAAIWIVLYILPVLAVLYLVFFLPLRFIWRAWRRRNPPRKPARKPAAPQDPPPTQNPPPAAG